MVIKNTELARKWFNQEDETQSINHMKIYFCLVLYISKGIECEEHFFYGKHVRKLSSFFNNDQPKSGQ